MIFGLAVVFDLGLGGKRFLGWLPGPDDLFGKVATFLKTRLDRTTRSTGERFARGVVVFIVLVPSLFLLGQWVTPLVLHDNLSAILAAFALALMVRQRRLWDNLLGNKSRSASENRQLSQAMIVGFADSMVIGGLLFTVGGFALLLPYRFGRALMDQETGNRAMRPSSPFLRPLWPLVELLALPGGLLSALLIAMAHIFIPGTNLGAVAGLFQVRRHAMLSRLWPLGVAAQGLDLSYRFANTKGAPWIGPEKGRAKQTGADTRRVALILTVAILLGVLLSLMALAAIYA